MSIICVEKTEDRITFMADTQMTYCDEPKRIKKIFGAGHFVFGIATDQKPHTFLQDRLLKAGKQGVKFYDCADVEEFFEDIRLYDGLPTRGFGEDDQILVADDRTFKVFYINPHSMTIYEVEDFDAIGSGAQFALGAYDAGGDIETAVKSACKRNIYCSEPLVRVSFTRQE